MTMTFSIRLSLLLLLLRLTAAATSSNENVLSSEQQQQQQSSLQQEHEERSLQLQQQQSQLSGVTVPAHCLPAKRPFDPFHHKETYRVGVHAIRGPEAAVKEYNLTYSQYLTETAGKRFYPPIKFEMVPLSFEGIFKAIEDEELDFLYANPSVFSCVGTEVGATALTTIVSRLEVRGQSYDLDVFGGVIATRKDNDQINTILDLKDKVIAAGAISQIMAGQMQFYEMIRAGLSYVNDPKQVIFTYNQFDIVTGLLDGTFDVGFVRTDTIERTVGPDGNLVDPDDFKVLEPKIFVMDNGGLFPFLHSTQIYPEWPVAAMTTVPKDVAYEVQNALLAIGEHARVEQSYQECLATNITELDKPCDEMNYPYDFDDFARCDTTRSIGHLANIASTVGKFAGFRATRSYFQARDMLQEAGFMLQNEKGDWYCTRPSNLYEGINCPDGHYKRSESEFERGCANVGLACKEGYDCYCKPCVKAFEVDVYEFKEGDIDYHLIDHFGEKLQGCEKMSICGVVEQGVPITLRIYDNRQRIGADVSVIMHAGDRTREMRVDNVPGTFAYEVSIVEQQVQVEVIEIFVNGKQIPQSPIRVQVVERDCDELYGQNSQREPDGSGQCICENNTYEIMGDCIQSQFFFLIIFSGVFLGVAIMVGFFLNYKRKQSDSVWHINVDELHFKEPPEVIGQGAFGVVILGQYRGTKVAVKRVIPPALSKDKDVITSSGNLNVTTNSGGGSTGEMSSNNSTHKKENNIDGLSSKKTVTYADEQHPQQQDIEASSPTKSKKSGLDSLTLPTAGTGGGDSWTNMLDPQKYDSAIKILAAATASGNGSFSGLSTLKSSSRKSENRLLSCLPYWMRFDEHSRLRREFLTEMRLLSKLRHPCITTVMGAVISSNVDPMLVMEYMDYGSLFDLLHNETMYTGGEVILQIVRDIVQGIQFLHASKPPILHGDLKAKNILVDSRFRAKVADFGFSHIKKEGKNALLQGTPFYMAPEYLRRRTEYNSACDIYALSMIFYEIYARAEPFEGEDPRKVLPKVCHPRVNRRPTIPDACPPKMAEIIKKCWSANPFFRPSAKDLDYILVELSTQDAEPLEKNKSVFKENMERRPTSLYDVFPKHIADALNSGQRVEPESHEVVTVVFSDIVGFTDISQTFSPLKVSNMLDRLYQKFDELANKHKIFKVETIGDAYMGVTNLDGTQFDTHVKCVAEYAVDAIAAALRIPIDEDAPDRGNVQIRVGFHSGPVVSNVIGSLNPRYGLFGDTVNTASRMETNSVAGKILCSYASAKILETQAPDFPISLRGKVNVKGKGSMITYWVGNTTFQDFNANDLFDPSSSPDDVDGDEEHPSRSMDIETILQDVLDEESVERSGETCSLSETSSTADSKQHDEDHQKRLQEKVTKLLLHHLMLLAASRPSDAEKRTPEMELAIKKMENDIGHGKTPLEEATEYVSLSTEYSGQHSQRNPAGIHFNKKAQEQLGQYVSAIACMHNPNSFHNFDHAAHVMVSVHKLLTRIVAPEDTANLALVNDKSFGIHNDKLAQFAVVFSALIHDIDHRGVPNFCLAKENHQLNFRYRGKALAEQNAADLGWEVLMSPQFDQLRACIYTTEEELLRFRRIVVNIIVATDIFDPELAKRRLERWDRAFNNNAKRNSSMTGINTGSKTLEDVSRQSTNVLEHLIQASDIAHTMQDWRIYVRWNERLFKELCIAHKLGRFPKEPSSTWYQGEIQFFDNYVIPLAEKMNECGIFGSSGGEFVKYAISNRDRWILEGKQIVSEMTEKIQVDVANAIPSLV